MDSSHNGQMPEGHVRCGPEQQEEAAVSLTGKLSQAFDTDRDADGKLGEASLY
jgi:hypothetical protein